MTDHDLPDFDTSDQITVEWLADDDIQCFVELRAGEQSFSLSFLEEAARSLRDQLTSYLDRDRNT